MKKYIQPFKYILFGFVTASMLSFITQCNKEDDPLFDSVNKDLVELDIDTKGANKASEVVEDLFLDADMNALIDLKFDDTNTASQNISYSNDDLIAIGKAFKKRTTTYIGESIVEYTYKIDDEEYTMVMGRDNNGEWKIVRF